MPGKTVKLDLREPMVIAFNPYKLMEMSFSEGNKAPEKQNTHRYFREQARALTIFQMYVFPNFR
ncbi:hypothetical protein [Microcoleus asticus]|nr:hypothetical protein [Microcoleus asticus]